MTKDDMEKAVVKQVEKIRLKQEDTTDRLK